MLICFAASQYEHNISSKGFKIYLNQRDNAYFISLNRIRKHNNNKS